MKIIKYTENPFLSDQTEIKFRNKKITIGPTKSFSLIDHSTGDVSGVAFQTYKEVDSNQFIKIYTENVGLIFKLNNTGKKVFQILLRAIQKTAINKDKIYLNLHNAEIIAKEIDVQIKKTSFYVGIKELIKCQIIAKSNDTNVFFINPHVLFNGDRVAFINAFKKNPEIEYKNEEIKNTKVITNQNLNIQNDSQTNKLQEFHRLKGLMISKYNIPEYRAKELLTQFSIERIQGVIRKIDRLTKINSWMVDSTEKRTKYFIECIEKNITE